MKMIVEKGYEVQDRGGARVFRSFADRIVQHLQSLGPVRVLGPLELCGA